MRPVASPMSVVMVRQPYGGTPNVMDDRTMTAEYKEVNPAQYKVSVGPGAMIVALTETSAPGWSLTGHGKAIAAQGWMAAWPAEMQPVEGTARYIPSTRGRQALMLLPIALLGAFSAMFLGRWWRRREAARQERIEAATAAGTPPPWGWGPMGY